MRVKCLAQEHNTMTRPGLEPRSESGVITTRPPRLPHFMSLLRTNHTRSHTSLLYGSPPREPPWELPLPVAPKSSLCMYMYLLCSMSCVAATAKASCENKPVCAVAPVFSITHITVEVILHLLLRKEKNVSTPCGECLLLDN